MPQVAFFMAARNKEMEYLIVKHNHFSLALYYNYVGGSHGSVLLHTNVQHTTGFFLYHFLVDLSNTKL